MNRRIFMQTTAAILSLAAFSRPGRAVNFVEEDAFLTVAGVDIPCRVTRPDGDARGAILLLPGSLYSDVDGNYPQMNIRPHAYADLARQLGGEGYVVLRIAKIGPGTGSMVVDAAAATAHGDFRTRVTVAAAALRKLESYTEARPRVVMGHSEGAPVAFLLASGEDRDAIDGVVSLSGPSTRIFDIMREQFAAMPTSDGGLPNLSVYDRLVADLRAGRRIAEEAAHDPQTAMLATMPAAAIDYLRSVDAVDPVVAVGAVSQPLLFVQGGHDPSVPMHHAERLRAAYRGAAADVVVFPELNHFYKITPEAMPPMASMMLDSESDPTVAAAIAHWVSGLSK